MSMGLLMVLCHWLFRAGTPFPKWLAALWVLQLLLEDPIPLALAAVGLIPDTLGPAALRVLNEYPPSALQLLFAFVSIRWIFEGWPDDMVSLRRNLRFVMLLILLVIAVFAICLERMILPWDSVVLLYVHQALNALMAAITLAAVFGLMRADVAGLLDPIRSREPDLEYGRATAASDLDLDRLVRAFTEDNVHHEGGMTVAGLARHLALPEYRMRKLIHERLGFRNFNALLNHYRIEDACRALADPAQAHTPVLTIALGVGYQSINPFNRAFRELKQVTPTEYRRAALSDRAPATEPN